MATPPAPQTVEYPLGCVGCGYDLDGLSTDAPCPECGLPIGRSVSGDHLFASEPAHIRRLHRGARHAMLGAVAGWVSVACMSGLLLVPYIGAWPTLAASVGLAATAFLTGIGWQALTRDDPEGIGLDRRGVGIALLRSWAVACTFVAAPSLAAVSLATLAVLAPSPGGQASSLPWIVAASGLGMVLLAMSVQRPLSALAEGLANRLLEGELAASARALDPASSVALVFILVASVLVVLNAPWWLRYPGFGAAALSALVWGVLYHAVIRGLHRALGLEAQRLRTT
ncbi:MAG: hypothetical protein AAFX79_05755 [Planctomycetota bacterium]